LNKRSRNRKLIDELGAKARLVTDSGGDPRNSQLLNILTSGVERLFCHRRDPAAVFAA